MRKRIYKNYEVTDDGRVFSTPRTFTKGGELTYYVDQEGFERVTLTINGKGVQKRVHRLVAMAFKKKKRGYDIVIHKNGDLRDNRAKNLQWVQYKSTPVRQMSGGITIAEFDSIADASRATGIPASTIARCLNKKWNTAGGYWWEKIKKR